MHIFWDYTKHCNLTCIHCYNAPERNSSPSDINTLERLALVSDIVKKYPNATLHFLGGEPLISKDFIEVADYAKRQGLTIQITTNGTVHTDKIIDFISNNCSAIHVSLDGPNAEINDSIRGAGVFKNASTFIQKLRENSQIGIKKLDLSYTVTKFTLHLVDELIQYCVNNEIPSLTIQPMKILGNAFNSKDELNISIQEYFEFGERIARRSLGEKIKITFTGGSRRYKDYIKWNFYNDIVDVESTCGAGNAQLRITSTGKILPCIMGNTASPKAINEWSHITSSVSEIVQLNSFIEFTTTVHRNSYETGPNICQQCSHLTNRECYPGCPVQQSFGPAMLCQELNRKNLS